MTTILEAVKQVPHGPKCRYANVLEITIPGRTLVGECDCDRDERIAKGVEALFDHANCGTRGIDADDVAAFTRAASLDGR